MRKIYLKMSLVISVFLMSAASLFGQSQVSGIITDASNNEPLIGATVLEKGTSNGMVTGLDGKYSLTVEDDAVLVISSVGFVSIEVVASSAKDVELQVDVTALDEVVVTGLASSIKRSNLANAVATVSRKTLTGITNQSTMDGALYGKLKGVEITSNSGAPGGGISIKLRGVTSLFGDSQPLYIIDGIYLDNSTISLGNNIISEAAGGGNPSTNQDDASNRIADIDPEDIESISILKGASAAAIYGSRAAGGVIVITTKRGQSGDPQVQFSQTVGLRTPSKLLGLRDWDSDEIIALDSNANANDPLTDYEAELFDNIRVSTTSRVEITGGGKNSDYFFATTYKNEPGLVENTGYEKGSYRFNFGVKLNDWLDVYVTNNYINAVSDRGFFNNGNVNRTIGYALAFTYPWEDLSPVNGVYPASGAGSNVLETAALTTNREQVSRYIGGATATIKILSQDNNQLKLLLQSGLDQYTLRTTSIFPQELTYFRDPSSLGGASISGTTRNSTYNLTASLVYNYFLDNGLSFTTQVGSFLQDFDRNTVITTATGLNGSQTNLGQSTNVGTSQIIRLQKDRGFFVQEELNYQDKLIGTLGYRGDKSTNNGDANQFYFYPKASLAINLHEFDFYSFSNALSNLKLRIAYGESGRFSNFNDRFTLQNAQLIGGTSGVSPGNLQGNGNVGPEIQKETEYGVDLGILNNRFGIDVTFYTKKTEDVLLQVDVPNSSGFTARVDNAAELENKGVEIGLNGAILQNGPLIWNTTINWWKNDSEVTKLEVPAFNEGGFAAALGTYRVEQGKSPTQIIGTYDVEAFTAEEIEAFDPGGTGFRVYGNSQADFQMSWINEISYKNFDFNFLFHWKKGGDNINLTMLLTDLAGTSWDFDDSGLDPEGLSTNGRYRLSQAFVNPDPLIEDSGYIRLREISLYYTLPQNWIPALSKVRLGVSGRNLWSSFTYRSYDPEVSNFGNNVLGSSVEVTPYPSSKFFNFHLNINF